MLIFINIISIFTLLLCICWVIGLYPAYMFTTRVKSFEEMDVKTLSILPSLTVVMTACNEEKTIESAMKTLLEQSYTGLKIVAVNDRSTDRTGDILDQLSAENDCLKVVHIKKLPEGWLGKVHALQKGYESVKSDWVLFTDADVHFKEHTFSKAVTYSEEKKLDHFTLLPDPFASSLWMKIVLQTFGLMFITSTRTYNVGKPGRPEYVGCGAFNLVRKEMFDKTKGFEWLKMEVADDVGVGLLMKNAGGKPDFAATFSDVYLTWYETIGDMFKGLEKNIYGVAANYNFPTMLLFVFLFFSYSLAPFLAFYLSLYNPHMFIAGLAAYSSLIAGTMMGNRRFGFPVLPGLLLPIGFILIGLMLLRSGIMCEFRRGIEWRGTKYPLDELKKGRRVNL